MCKLNFEALSKGCVSVAVDGHTECRQTLGDAHTKFVIRVQNVWSSTTVKRRYKEFAELDAKLRPKMESLPDLPPKDFWNKMVSSLMNDKTFMIDREHALGKLLEAMVSMDPSLRHPELREFLGVACCMGDAR